MHIFRRIFLSNYWWQESDIWSQASYRYAILWEAFLDLSDSYFLFADLVGFYTHWTYMHIFRPIFLSIYCIDANHYDFSVIVTNFGPKLRCYVQQSTCYGFPIIAGPKPFPI